MSSVARDLGYSSTVERVYTINHPEVISWTNIFHEKMKEKKIFERFMASLAKDRLNASIVAAGWHLFSTFMPQFLCQAAAMVSNNVARHYVIQGAYEELGMRDNTQIHPDLFLEAAKSIELEISDRVNQISGQTKNYLDNLRAKLLTYTSDMQIFGVLLGLEIPATENIETIFTSMSYNNDAKMILEKSTFFLLHREIEAEHIRLAVANFLRFKESKRDIDNFVMGFMDGIRFWDSFWSGMKKATLTIGEGGSTCHKVKA